MISLKPVSEGNIPDFADTSFAEMSVEEKRGMIQESVRKEHNGSYFELYAVYDGDLLVGFMNLYAHAAHLISVAPEIKRTQRRRGYGYQGMLLALQLARDAGYTAAIAGVREDNPASIALHEKLGFELGSNCLSKNGKPMRIYVKVL